MHPPEAPQPADNKPYSLVRAIGWGVVLVVLQQESWLMALIQGRALFFRGELTLHEVGKILLFADIVSGICICTAVWLVVRYGRRVPVSDYLGFQPVSWKIIVCCLVGGMVGSMVGNSVLIAAKSNGLSYEGICILLKDAPSPSWMDILSGVFLIPFYEEVFFRGLLFRDLQRSWVGPRGAALLSTVLFTCCHIDGFSLSALPRLGLIFCGGLVMSWTRYKTRSIWPAVAIHVAWNGIGFIVFMELPPYALVFEMLQ